MGFVVNVYLYPAQADVDVELWGGIGSPDMPFAWGTTDGMGMVQFTPESSQYPLTVQARAPVLDLVSGVKAVQDHETITLTLGENGEPPGNGGEPPAGNGFNFNDLIVPVGTVLLGLLLAL